MPLRMVERALSTGKELAEEPRAVTESAGAKKTVGQVVVTRQRNVDQPLKGGR